jgi:hypothetical protein
MTGKKLPIVQTFATFDADLTCGGLSFDSEGNCYVSQNQHGVVVVFAGARGMREVALDFIEPEDFLCAACTPDGKLLFVRTENGAIWRVGLFLAPGSGRAGSQQGPM